VLASSGADEGGAEPAAEADLTASTPLTETPSAGVPQSAPPVAPRASGGLATTTRAARSSTPVSSGGSRPARAAAGVVRGSMAVVIDDAGYDLQQLEPFLALPGIVTIAVLPGLLHSAEAARMARAAGKPVMLHSPMQPVGAEEPGPGAITSGMSEERISSELSLQLAEVGPVDGINNHMGSQITADPEAMRAILRVAKSRGLVFLDSKTSADSVVEREAEAIGTLSAARDVFLDNEPAVEEIRERMEEAKRIARTRGRAVVIGHVQTRALAAFLLAALPELERDGYRLERVSALARESGRRGP
jgi:polysaccharide deacetylase 2 family uncharacterized protein YibQ